MAFNLYSTLENGLLIDEYRRTVKVIPNLEQKNYSAVKAIFQRLGGVWCTKEQVFNFRKCPRQLVERVLSVGSRRLNTHHFYPTPEMVFNYIARHTDLSFFGASRESVRVLEPECGEGSLMRQLLAFGEREGRRFEIDGYDIDPLNVLFCQEAGLKVEEADFLRVAPTQNYDLVLMNPPFNGDEFIKHIRHAQQFLRRDGLLISVVPTDCIYRCDNNEARQWLREQAQINGASSLNPGDFFEPGTFKGVSISTTVICMKSVEAAKGILGSDQYLSEAIEAFHVHVSNSAKCLDAIDAMRGSCIDDESLLAAVRSFVVKVMEDNSDDTIHLVRQYRDHYVGTVLETWFPRLRTAPICRGNPMQLDLISLVEGPLAA